MSINTMHVGVHASGRAGSFDVVAGHPIALRAGWALNAAMPQHKRRPADTVVASVKRGTA